MSLLRVTFIVLALAGAAGGASAFQEQRQGAPAAAPTPAASDSRPSADFSAPSAEAQKSGGTEVRVPGLGRLGNLPRMDFGLELLYGATEPKVPVGPSPRDERDDDLTIRGTVRHKF